MAEGNQLVSRHGRPKKLTYKMAQLLGGEDIAIKKQIEIDLLTTKLEITRMEQEIVCHPVLHLMRTLCHSYKNMHLDMFAL